MCITLTSVSDTQALSECRLHRTARKLSRIGISVVTRCVLASLDYINYLPCHTSDRLIHQQSQCSRVLDNYLELTSLAICKDVSMPEVAVVSFVSTTITV